MAYFNVNTSCELTQLVKTLERIETLIDDNISTNDVTVALMKANDVIKNRIMEIFMDIEVSNDGIKRLTIENATINSWSNEAQTFEYHYTGLFTTNGTKFILDPFPFVYEEPEQDDIDCNFDLMFKTNLMTIMKNNPKQGYYYYTETERRRIIKELPDNISNLVYNYLLHMAGVSRKPTSLSIIPLKKELTSFKEYLSNYNAGDISVLVNQINEISNTEKDLTDKRSKLYNEQYDMRNKCQEYWKLPEYQAHGKKIQEYTQSINNLNDQMTALYETLTKEIKLCMDYEKKVVHIISYISNSELGHTLFDTYKKYSNAANKRMLPNVYDDIDRPYGNTGNDLTVNVFTNCLNNLILDDTLSDHSPQTHRTLTRYSDKFATPDTYSRNDNTPNYHGCARFTMSDMKIPYLTTDDATSIIDVYKTEYLSNALAFDKRHTATERNAISDEAKALEIAFYANAKTKDKIAQTEIHTVDGTLNDLVFRPEIHNNLVIYHQNFCEDTLMFYPNDPYLSDTVKFAKATADRFEIIHEYIDNTVDKMLACLDDIQTRLNSIPDDNFKAYLVKHKMIEVE